MPSTEQRHAALYKALEELGLSESERQLYSLSLSLGPTSIATLADRLGISRPNIYKVIAQLQRHGLAQFSGSKQYTKSFIVESPSAVAELLRKKREEVASRDDAFVFELPFFLTQYQQGNRPTKISVLQGRAKLLQAYLQVFEEAKDEICFFGAGAEFVKFVSFDLGKQRIRRRVERGVKARSLTLPDVAESGLTTNLAELREARVLRSAAPFVTSFHLFANKALLWQPKGDVAVLIEDEYIVAMLKSMFDVMWNSAEPV